MPEIIKGEPSPLEPTLQEELMPARSYLKKSTTTFWNEINQDWRDVVRLANKSKIALGNHIIPRKVYWLTALLVASDAMLIGDRIGSEVLSFIGENSLGYLAIGLFVDTYVHDDNNLPHS